MKLNLDFYDGKDLYSDGDIENTIIKYIKDYDNYEDVFKNDSSWPVVYHLSKIRENIVKWYPFKDDCSILEIGAGMGAITSELCRRASKVTSIELSKRRATAILERNKNVDNLEIIVGNFQNIELKEKYDYVILNGVFEYGKLYINSENPYIDFLNKIKKSLKTNGKILIAIENKFGIKYWCGSEEDHSGLSYDGLNNYQSGTNARTFSKNELNNIALKCGMNANFYYVFPDYKFPEIILTDNFLSKNIFLDYSPYFANPIVKSIDERILYKEIFDNRQVSFFANSFFVELSTNKEAVAVQMVKFNNYRDNTKNLFTYLIDNKYFKKASLSESNDQISKILEIEKYMTDNKISHVQVKKENNLIYTIEDNNDCLFDIMNLDMINKNYNSIENYFDRIVTFIKKCSGKKIKNLDNNVYNKYLIKLNNKDLSELTFVSYGLTDICPSNILVENGEFKLIDQEWSELNVPIEYIIYRSLKNFFCHYTFGGELYKKLLKKYKINNKLFDKLDDRFLSSIMNDNYNYYKNNYMDDSRNSGIHHIIGLANRLNEVEDNHKLLEYHYNSLSDSLKNKEKEYKIQIKELNQKNNELEERLTDIYKICDELNQNNKEISVAYENIVNSKGWKFLEKIRKIKRFGRK